MRGILTRGASFAKRRDIISAVLRYNPIYYGQVARLLSEVPAMDRAQRRAMVEGLTSRTLAWARAVGAPMKGGGTLADWPILDKENVRANEVSLRKQHRVAIPAVTGGTTGVPLRLWRSLRCVAAEQAFLDRLLLDRGVSLRHTRMATLRGDHVKAPSERTAPYGRRSAGGHRLVLSSQHVSDDTIRWYADELTRFAPDVLWVYPSSGESLARHILSHGLEVPIPLVLSSSEVLHPAGRRTMAAAFGGQVVDYYGMAERVVLASSVRENEYWVNPAYGRVELQPVDDLDLPAGLASAEVIATGFWNDVMPLVRYRTGDFVVYPSHYGPADLEDVTLGIKPVVSITGRDSGFVVSPRGETLMVLGLMDNLDDCGIVRLQVVQEGVNEVRILVVSESGLMERARRTLQENIRRTLPDDIAVSVEGVDALERLPSGKVPYVVRRNVSESGAGVPSRRRGEPRQQPGTASATAH